MEQDLFEGVWEAPDASADVSVDSSVDAAPADTQTPETFTEEAPQAANDLFDGVFDEAQEQEFTLPDGDDDLAEYEGLPLARQLQQTRAYAREMAAKRAEWEAQQQTYSELGDAEYVKRAVDTYKGFFTPQTNEHGEVLYHPTTNLPLYTARPGLEAMSQSSPGRIMQILHDINQMQGPDGNGYLTRYVAEGLGLDADQLMALQRGELVPRDSIQPQQPTGAEGLHPQDREWVKTNYGEDADAAFLKYVFPKHGNDFFDLPAQAQKAVMEDAQERFAMNQKLSQVEEQQKQWAAKQEELDRAETQKFHQEINTSAQGYVKELRESAVNQIVKNLDEKVRFATDDKQHQAMSGIVKATLAAVLDPENSFSFQDLSAALNIRIDPSFYSTLESAATKAGEVKRLEAIAAHPRFSHYRDDNALANAKAQLDSSIRQAETVLNGIALQVAKVMGATAKAKSEQIHTMAAQRSGRPTLSGNPASPPARQANYEPFSQEAWNDVWS